MRERIEDLGRIMIMLENIIEMMDPDEICFYRRPKEAVESFRALSEEQQNNIVHSMAYRIEDIKEMLYKTLEVARGEDVLNEREYGA